jgi:hypothetical protein
MTATQTTDSLQRLKVLIDSSTPIVVMETVEEVRAVRMVRSACADCTAFDNSRRGDRGSTGVGKNPGGASVGARCQLC